ncbi:MAG TPA: BTAD domain-containing putative transcriptional regulator, partial [Gemmatimonadaceae bacterium]|nr:BTAD domain-containing putative transcriptional regulator [Gemmatimonadaceae bacterium]
MGIPVQRRRVALLALLALADERGVSRDKILGCLWPESDTEHARSRLNVAVYSLRKALGETAIISEAEGLRINSAVIGSDVADFEAALERDDAETAIAIYSGPLLDGFFIADAPEFERWVERERDRLGRSYCEALEKLAEQSEREGHFDRSAEWWKLRAAYDPYDSRVALRLMHALDASGNTAAALQKALMHEKRLNEDFGVEPSAELKNATANLRARHAAVEGMPFVRNEVGHELRPRARSVFSSAAVISGASDGENDSAPRARIRSLGNFHDVPIHRQHRRYAFLAGILIVSGSVAGLGLSSRESAEIRGISKPPHLSLATIAGIVGEPDVKARHEAEDLYYQARYLTTANQNATGFGQALALYSKAAERDPTFAKAYAGMADAYNYMENPRDAKAAALKALSIDSTTAEAFNALAYVYAFYEHRWLAADSAVERATKLSPRFTLAHLRRANNNAALGRPDVAFASLEKARAIEPESWTVLYNRGSVASALGMNDEAINHLEAALALAPERIEARAALAWQYWGVGRKDDAAALFRNAGDRTEATMLSGDTTQLRSLIQRFETDSTTLPACQAAAVYIELGQKDA